jgi:hypothetical protein
VFSFAAGLSHEEHFSSANPRRRTIVVTVSSE